MLFITKDNTASPTIYSAVASAVPYDSLTQYYVGKLVTYNLVIYRCIAPALGIIPTNTTYWVEAPYDPVKALITIDATGTPTSVSSYSDAPVYIWADNTNKLGVVSVGFYSSLQIEVVGTLDPGITWELSLDDITFATSVVIPDDLDVTIGYAAILIYVKATAVNDDTLVTDVYTAPKLMVSGVENAPT